MLGKFETVTHIDLNGTIIAGDEEGGKSPEQSILTDLLECWQIPSAEEFIATLSIPEIEKQLNIQFHTSINFNELFEKYQSDFSSANFYDNFKILLQVSIHEAQSKIKLNDLLKYFLDSEQGAIDCVLKDKHQVAEFKIKIDTLKQLIHPETHILQSFDAFASHVIQCMELPIHIAINTFGSEAPKVINTIENRIPLGQAFMIEPVSVEKKEHTHYLEISDSKKAATMKQIHECTLNERLVSIVSNFKHYDTNGRKNNAGKVFPIDSERNGLYIFFDDNLSHKGLNDKGCVNIHDVKTACDIDFSSLKSLFSEDETPDIKAKKCGKAIVVFVRARLSSLVEKTALIDIVTKYQQLAQQYYLNLGVEVRNRHFFHHPVVGTSLIKERIGYAKNNSDITPRM